MTASAPRPWWPQESSLSYWAWRKFQLQASPICFLSAHSLLQFDRWIAGGGLATLASVCSCFPRTYTPIHNSNLFHSQSCQKYEWSPKEQLELVSTAQSYFGLFAPVLGWRQNQYLSKKLKEMKLLNYLLFQFLVQLIFLGGLKYNWTYWCSPTSWSGIEASLYLDWNREHPNHIRYCCYWWSSFLFT